MRWSPARMPRPPEYWGSAAAIPYSGEKYAIAAGPDGTTSWYQDGAVMYRSRSATAASMVASSTLSDEIAARRDPLSA